MLIERAQTVLFPKLGPRELGGHLGPLVLLSQPGLRDGHGVTTSSAYSPPREKTHHIWRTPGSTGCILLPVVAYWEHSFSTMTSLLPNLKNIPDVAIVDEKNLATEELHLDRVDSAAMKYDDKQGAINAELAEQSMTFKQAIREYPNAVFWSWAISLCIIMEGYDTALPVGIAPRLFLSRPMLTCYRATLSVCRRTVRTLASTSTKRSATSSLPPGKPLLARCLVSGPYLPSLPAPGFSNDTAIDDYYRLASSPCFASSLSSSSPRTL